MKYTATKEQIGVSSFDGQLNAEERGELEALAELSGRIALVRADALHLLGRRPE